MSRLTLLTILVVSSVVWGKDLNSLKLQGTWMNPNEPGTIALIKSTKMAGGFVISPNQQSSVEWVAGAGKCLSELSGEIHFVGTDGTIRSTQYNVTRTSIGNVMKFSTGGSWTRVLPYTSMNNEADLVEAAIQTMMHWYPTEELQLLSNMSQIIHNVMTNSTPSGLTDWYFPKEDTALYQPELSFTPCEVAIATVIEETIMFVVGLMGLHGIPNKIITNAILRDMGVATLNGLQTDIKAIETASSAFGKAKALFGFAGKLYSAGGFKIAFKAIRSSMKMSWWKWTKLVAGMLAQLAAWFATDGVAFVAKVALSILSATTLLQSIANAVKVCHL